MSDPEFVSPEIIQFKGIFADIPEMHELLGEEDSLERFHSTENQKSRLVSWLHSTKLPHMHNFAVVDPFATTKAPYNMYNLVIDDLNEQAHLYVYRCLGDVTCRDASENVEELQNEWTGFQIAMGLTMPNTKDIANFKQIFEDFYVNSGKML